MGCEHLRDREIGDLRSGFIDRANQLVIAKLSSQALPVDVARIGLTLRAVSQLRKRLA